MRRSLGAVSAAAVALLLAAPLPSARGDGNPCVADGSAAGWTVIALTNPPDVNPFMQSTVWSGVITRWKVPVATGLGPLAQQLAVFEQVNVDEESRYRKIAESAMETVVAGTNEFATRIPLHGEGHRYVGLTGPVETLFCDEQSMTVTGIAVGDFPLGEIRPVEIEMPIGAPVTVVAEPDRDGDGYGDLTQDRCERSAATQGECPTVTPSAVAKLEPGAIVLTVRTDSEGWVKPAGQVSWKLQPKARKRAGASKKVGRRFIATLKAAEQFVSPASTATFRMPLPKSVKRRLGEMKRRRSLRAKITVTATDLAYRERSTVVDVKLPGRKRGNGPS